MKKPWHYIIVGYEWNDEMVMSSMVSRKKDAFVCARNWLKARLYEGVVSIGGKRQRVEIERVWFPHSPMWRTRKLIRTYETIF